MIVPVFFLSHILIPHIGDVDVDQIAGLLTYAKYYLHCRRFFVNLYWGKYQMSDYNKFSDSELAELFRSGDDAAFKEIFLRYDKLLFLYAFNKLRDEEEAKDAVQDVFLWLLKNKHTLLLKTTLSGYLYKSTLNRVFDIFKHNNIVKKYIDAGEYFIDVDSEETDFLIREKDIASLIEQEINAMPPRMKEIYQLKRKQYLSTKEIARQLDISEHTVANQLKKASKHLKTKLGVVIFVLHILNP
jgi:RNA polymerase sigma-70 factor (family 1)